MSDRRLAILSYHKVGKRAHGGWESWYYVPQPTFYRQLEQLREEGWKPVDWDTVLAGLGGEDVLPPRAVLVTFDDGYRSLLDYALPVLGEYRCPGVVFVPTDHVGGYNAFDVGHSSEPREELCDWEELAELEAAGVAVQSHGASHRSFSDLHVEAVEEELRRSKASIEDRLERPVRLLAYPYGDPGRDPQATATAAESSGYLAGCLYGGGPLDPAAADRFALTRIAVGPDTDLRAELA